MRGSAKHVLDLLEREDYVQVMNGLLADGGASITQEDARRPLGWDDATEWDIRRFCDKFCHDWFAQDLLSTWWPGRPAKPPMWDMISTCRVGERQGILLMEAKAHEGECSYAGKELEPSASRESKKNHQQIIACMNEAQDGLNHACDGVFRLGTESHYQLTNRIAHLWKLASCGIPAVLLYLGFTGDTYFKRDYLTDADHWQRVMGAYMRGVIPLGFPGRVVQLSSGGSVQMLIRSLPVVEVSSN